MAFVENYNTFILIKATYSLVQASNWIEQLTVKLASIISNYTSTFFNYYLPEDELIKCKTRILNTHKARFKTSATVWVHDWINSTRLIEVGRTLVANFQIRMGDLRWTKLFRIDPILDVMHLYNQTSFSFRHILLVCKSTKAIVPTTKKVCPLYKDKSHDTHHKKELKRKETEIKEPSKYCIIPPAANWNIASVTTKSE